MWVIVRMIMREYAPAQTVPIAGAIVLIGYYLEGLISRYTPATAPVNQQREERLLGNIDSSNTRQKHNPLEVNLPPSLST